MIDIGTLLGAIKITDELSPAVQSAIDTLRGMDQQLNMTAGQTRVLAEHLGLTSEEMKKLDLTSRMTAAQLSEVTKSSSMTAYQMTLLGRGMTEAGMLMSGLSLAILGGVKAIVDYGSEFEKQMTKVITLAGASRQQVEQMTQPVLDLSTKAGVSSSELAKGLYVLMSTGRDTKESMEQLRVSAEMSALGMGSVHDTTLAVTGAMFAYRESNLTASDAANTLIKAVQLGNMEVQDLVPAIARVNPIAAALGVSFKDVAAGMATFTHAGVDSATAATGMRAMLNNILTDSAKTEKGFAALSKALGDSSISMANFRQEMKDKGFTTAMVDLANKVTAAGDAGVQAFGSIFPNIRALTEALFVYKSNGGMVVNMLKDMNDQTDELAKGTAELHKTFAWQWEQMKVGVEKFWITLSNSLLPVFKGVLTLFQSGMSITLGMAQAFNNLGIVAQAPIISFLGILAVMGPLLLVSGQFVMAIGNISRALQNLDMAASPKVVFGFFTNPAFLAISGLIIAISSAIIIAKGNLQDLGTYFLMIAGAMGVLSGAAYFLAGSITFLSASTVAFFTNPWFIGAALVIGGIGVAFKALTEETRESTESISASAAEDIKKIEALKDLEKEISTCSEESRSFEDVARSLISISPSSIAAVGGEKVAYQDLTKAIADATTESKYQLRIKNELLAIRRTELQAQIDEATRLQKNAFETIKPTTTVVRRFINREEGFSNVPVTSTDRDKAREEYVKQSDALNKLNSEFNQLNETINRNKEIYNENWHAQEENRRATEAAAAAARELHQTQFGGVVAAQRVIDSVGRLTEAQKKYIQAEMEHGRTIQQTIADMKDQSAVTKGFMDNINNDVVSRYREDLKQAAAHAKSLAKETKAGSLETEAYARVLAQIQNNLDIDASSLNRMSDEFVTLGLKAGASATDVTKASGQTNAAVQYIKQGIDEAAKAQKIYDRDLAWSAAQRKALELDTASNIAKAENDSFEAKRLALERDTSLAISELQKKKLSYGDYFEHLLTLMFNYQAKVGALNNQAAQKNKEYLASLTVQHQEWVDRNLALEEEYNSLVGQISGDTLNSRLDSIQSDKLKKFSEISKKVSKDMADIGEAFDKGWFGSGDQAAEDAQAALLEIFEQGEKAKGTIAGIAAATQILARRAEEVKYLSAAFSSLANISEFTSGPIKAIGSAITGIVEAGGNMSKKLIAGFSAAAEVVQQYATGSIIAAAATGALSGASAGLALSMTMQAAGYATVGAAFAGVGAAVGALIGVFSAVQAKHAAYAKEVAEANKTLDAHRQKLIEITGGYQSVLAIGKVVGIDLAGAWNYAGVWGLQEFERRLEIFTQKQKELTESVVKNAGYASKALIELMNVYMQTTGDTLKTAQDFFKSQLNLAVEGFNDILGGMQASADKVAQDAFIKLSEAAGMSHDKAVEAAKDVKGVFLTSQEMATGLGASLAAVFADMVSRGMTFAEVFKALKDPIQIMEYQLEAAGLKGGSAFNLMDRMAKIVYDDVNGPLATAIGGVNKALLGMNATQLLNQESFTGLTLAATQAYDQIIKNGADSQAALMLMQPTLQTIWKLQKDYGYTLDENTQKLVDQAVEQGIVGDKFRTDAEKQTAALEKIALSMDVLVEFFKKLFPDAVKQGFDKATTEVDNFKDRLDRLPDKEIKIRVNSSIQSDSDATVDSNTPNFVDGSGGFRNFGSGTLAMLHGTEAVVRPQDLQGGTTIVIQAWDGASVDQWLRSGGDKKLAQAVVPRIPSVVKQYGLQ